MKVTLSSKTQPLVENLSIEEYLIHCARVSSTKRLDNETAPGLMRYLLKHKHMSPFEMVSFGFEIQTSRAIAQQIIRHRSFSFQEFSQRYARVTDIEPLQLREQATDNRQSSSDVIEDTTLDLRVHQHLLDSQYLYLDLLDKGVARECARGVLPLTTSTTLVMHGTLRSWIHFLEQRCSDHAQKEIRDIAFKIRDELSKEVPCVAIAVDWI
jgi:thymidylate synthase (FAD)